MICGDVGRGIKYAKFHWYRFKGFGSLKVGICHFSMLSGVSAVAFGYTAQPVICSKPLHIGLVLNITLPSVLKTYNRSSCQIVNSSLSSCDSWPQYILRLRNVVQWRTGGQQVHDMHDVVQKRSQHILGLPRFLTRSTSPVVKLPMRHQCCF